MATTCIWRLVDAHAGNGAYSSMSGGSVTLPNTAWQFSDHSNLSSRQAIGMRWDPAHIIEGEAPPRGATILAAHLRFTAHGTYVNIDGAELRFEATDHAAPFTTEHGQITNRARGEQVAYWDGNLNPNPTPTDSVDIAHLVQEVVDRPGWEPGNAMALLGFRTGIEWRHTMIETGRWSGVSQPELHVTWEATTGLAAVPPARARVTAPGLAELRRWRRVTPAPAVASGSPVVVATPAGPTVTYFDGATHHPVSLSHFDGATEVPVTLERVGGA